MGQNVERLTRFVNDLLDVAALDRGKVQLSRKSWMSPRSPGKLAL